MSGYTYWITFHHHTDVITCNDWKVTFRTARIHQTSSASMCDAFYRVTKQRQTTSSEHMLGVVELSLAASLLSWGSLRYCDIKNKLLWTNNSNSTSWTRQCPQDNVHRPQPFLKREGSRSRIDPRSCITTNVYALPLGQAGSQKQQRLTDHWGLTSTETQSHGLLETGATALLFVRT